MGGETRTCPRSNLPICSLLAVRGALKYVRTSTNSFFSKIWARVNVSHEKERALFSALTFLIVYLYILSSGSEQQITIRSSGGLSEDEIQKMVWEAELHAQKDHERKALIDIRNSVDTSIYSIEKSLTEYRDKIPAEVASEIEAAVAELRKAMAGESANEIKAKLDAANQAVSKIGQHMAGGASGGGQGGAAGGPPEAEYEEVKK